MSYRKLNDDYAWITPDNCDAVLDSIEVLTISQQPGRLPPDQWDVIRRAVLHRDGYRCGNCEATKTRLDVHHIVRIQDGGSNLLSNLRTICFDCHHKVHPWMVNYAR